MAVSRRARFLRHDGGMKKNQNSRPGDVFVERYMPGASADEREAAYQSVLQLVAVLVRVNERMIREADSPESDSCGRFSEPDAFPAI